MSRISKNILTLLIIVSVSPSGWSASSDEPGEMLARAEALYYEADFAKSVELLSLANELLEQQPGHAKEKAAVKLQLALGLIGLNDSARAKAYLGELYALDSEYRLDPDMFSPKVIRLADEAKAEQNELRCRSVLDETQRQLESGNGDAVVRLIGSSRARCSGLAVLNSRAADLVFKEGLEAYRKAQTTEALRKFRAALGVEPQHEMAAQYVDLTESKLEVAAERALLEWRKDFNAGEYELAARDYRDLISLSSAQTTEEVRLEYRHALTSLVDSWNLACANDDAEAMEKLRVQVNALLPEPTFGEDILARMKTCSHTDCIPMDTQLALARLRSRVNPQFPAYVTSLIKVSPVRVRVKARIDENGNVTGRELEGGNPVLYDAIRSAIGQWKFTPAIVEGGPRCVDTEFPFVINFGN